MPPEEVVEEVVEIPAAEPVDERRAAIEAAFDAQQEPEDEPAKPVGLPPAPESRGTPKEVAPKAVGEKPDDTGVEGSPTEQQEKPVRVDRAPQSWRAGSKAKWEGIDPDVKQEVVRREREITRVLADSAGARQVVTNLQQAVAPFATRLQAMNADPVKAFQEMLRADYLLATGGKRQKSEMIAKFIKDYEVDVVDLDSVLSGQQRQPTPTDGVEELLQKRLAPFEQYMAQQRQTAAQRKAADEAAMQQSIEDMATDPEYPHFEDVRDTMADLIEINARKGVSLSLKECYNKALAMDPRISTELAAQNEAATKAKLVAERNARAQRAKLASSSITGAPSVVRVGAPATDRRAIIEAAFEAQNGGA